MTHGQIVLMSAGSRALYGEALKESRSGRSAAPRDDVIRPPKPFKQMTAMEYMSWMDMVGGGLI